MPLSARRALALARSLAGRGAPVPGTCASGLLGALRPALPLSHGATRSLAAAAVPRFLYHAAVYLMLERGDELLMMKRAGTGFGDGAYSLPCGHMDGGETAAQAMQREALEELGIVVALGDLSVRCVQHRPSGAREYFDVYLSARAWEGEPRNREPHKCAELAWFPAHAPPQGTLEYVRAALAAARAAPQQVHFLEHGWPPPSDKTQGKLR